MVYLCVSCIDSNLVACAVHTGPAPPPLAPPVHILESALHAKWESVGGHDACRRYWSYALHFSILLVFSPLDFIILYWASAPLHECTGAGRQQRGLQLEHNMTIRYYWIQSINHTCTQLWFWQRYYKNKIIYNFDVTNRNASVTCFCSMTTTYLHRFNSKGSKRLPVPSFHISLYSYKMWK